MPSPAAHEKENRPALDVSFSKDGGETALSRHAAEEAGNLDVSRQAFGTEVITRDIIGEQQQIADTCVELGLIPKHVDVLKAAPPDLA